MLGVHGRAVVILLAALADIVPSPLLFLEIEARGIGKEQPGDEHAAEAEPRHDVELLLGGDVVVQHGGGQGAEFPDCGAEAVCGGADGRGEYFGGDEEGYRVGAELVEEGGQEVHGLEGVDVRRGSVVFEVEGGDHEQDKIHGETDDLHPFPAVQLVIDEEGCKDISFDHRVAVAVVGGDIQAM